MKKILITGVAGFIGSNLANFLLKFKKYHIIGLDNLSYGKLSQVPKGINFYKTDIRSKKISNLFSGVDVVFHLAAKNCIPDCQADPVETFDINVHGSINVFHYAKISVKSSPSFTRGIGRAPGAISLVSGSIPMSV